MFLFPYLMASIATSSELNKTQQEEYIVKLKVLSNGPTHVVLVDVTQVSNYQ